MKGKRRIRPDTASVLFLVVLIGAPAGLTYRSMQIEKLRRPLIEAIRTDNAPRVKALLARGADPNARDRPAVRPGLLEYLKSLFRRPRRGEEEAYPTVLMLAAERANADAAHLLLDRGARVNARGPNRTTALHRAAAHGHVWTTRLLLERGAGINAVDTDGNTPLLMALQDYQGTGVPCALLLLERGADARPQNHEGNTALEYTVQQDRYDLWKPLLQHGADPNTRVDYYYPDVPLLCYMTGRGRAREVRLLLDFGADPNLRGDGPPALFEALALENTDPRRDYRSSGDPFITDAARREVVSLLLKGRADPNTRDLQGQPILNAAVEARRADIVDRLLDGGADLNRRDAEGRTPLMEAVLQRDPALTRLLLARRANPNAADAGGDTPLMAAAFNGDGDLVRLLLRHGADVRRRDAEGLTALRFAADSPGVARLLRLAGAR